LDARTEGTLQQRIKQLVVEGILSGRFQPGERMPSSRALAKHLGVSRITITLAYTDLVADDYLVSRGRSGYFISDSAPTLPRFEITRKPAANAVDWDKAIAFHPSPAVRIKRPADWQSYPYPFIYGQADRKHFDQQNWRQCALQALGRREFNTLTADHYESDDSKLVDYILRHILTRRGIVAGPENILITLGAQNAIWIAAQLLLTSERTAVMENPGYPGLREILEQTGCKIVSVDVDNDGLPPEALPDTLNVLFTTVSHQCPTNTTMPLERRRRLLDLAADRGFIIVEDDYEFEMSFERSPSPALKSFDEIGSVIYLGSFSKSLFPGLRLGYLVGSETFIERARLLRATVLRHPPGLIQRTAAYFLSSGHYDAQINRMRKALQRRRVVMEAAIDEHGLKVAGAQNNGGSSFWMRGPDGMDAGALAQRLHDRGVIIEPGNPFFANAPASSPFYRLAYSSIPSSKISDGIRLVADEIERSGHSEPRSLAL
jgi:GntR family transcriptional regulator/MocR family aminotransferase